MDNFYRGDKKSNTIHILIGIIVVLSIGVVILIFSLLGKNNNSNDLSSNSYQETTMDTNVTSSTNSAETTSIQNTNDIEQFSSDEISTMYSSFISEHQDPNHNYTDSRYGYSLIDLNNDGTQELLITLDEVEKGSPGVMATYAIYNKKLTQLWISDDRFIGSLCEGNIINSYSALGSGGGNAFYQYKSGNQLDLIDMVSFDYTSGSKVMYHNNEVITESEADSILAQYKNKQFDSKPLTITSTAETTTETTVQSTPTETYIFFGIVATESGTLNLRDKPSTDSNVIAQLEKGTKGDIFRIDGIPDWYKMTTQYGQTGYVSAQYIKEYDHSSGNSQGGDNSDDDSSYTPPTEVIISLNKGTPIEFSKYDGDTLISTIRLDRVEYDLKLSNPSKHSDTDYDEYYIDLRFYFTKTYDRYANEQRYSSNPAVYFNIQDLTAGKIWRDILYDKTNDNIIANITPSSLKREGDTGTYSWSSHEIYYTSSLALNSSHQYVINIMDGDEAFNQ